jgi:hypothetical protein
MLRFAHARAAMREAFVLVALLVWCTAVYSCATVHGDKMNATGTVVFLPIEGGFYGIQGDDGKKYDPANLPDEFRKDGLRIRYEVKEVKGRAGVHMWGTIVEIVHIEKL